MARKRTSQEIDAEIARLQKEREDTRKAEKAGVVSRMKEAIAYYDITAADLGLDGVARKASKSPRATANAKPAGGRIKYRDEAGHTWSGFGPKPKWFAEALAAGKTEADLRAAA
jgi:DNA-binding protein H-NS